MYDDSLHLTSEKISMVTLFQIVNSFDIVISQNFDQVSYISIFKSDIFYDISNKSC